MNAPPLPHFKPATAARPVMADAPPARPKKPPRVYECKVCHKNFKRSEHCSRHERGHTNERPFSCRFCGRRYARKDLVSRHEQTFHPLGYLEMRQQQPKQTFEPHMSLGDTQDHFNNHGSVTTQEHFKPHDGTPENSVRRDQQMLPPAMHDGQQEQMGNYNDHMTQYDYLFSQEQPSNAHQETGHQDGKTAHHDAFHGMEDSSEPMLMPMQNQTTPLSSHANTDMSGMSNNLTSQYGNHHDPFDHRNPVENQASNHQPHGQQHMQDRQHERLENSQGMSIVNHQRTNHFRPSDHWFGDPVPSYLTSMNSPSQDLGQNDARDHSPNHKHQHPINQGGNPRTLSQNAEDIDFFSIDASALDMNYSISTYLFNSGYSPNVDIDPPAQQWTGNDRGSSCAASDAVKATPQKESIDPRNAPGSFARLHGSKGKPLKMPITELDEAKYAHVLAEARSRLSSEDAQKFRLPSSQKLDRFFTSYLTCFHHHFPVVHLQTLRDNNAGAPLIMAMCAIGALYRLNRKVAKDLWTWAQKMVDQELRRDPNNAMKSSPTEALQCKFLLTVFAVFNGDIPDVVAATESMGMWATEYRLRRTLLALPNSGEDLSWAEWTERETSKRLLCGIFILSSALTVTYDTVPFLSLTQDLNFEMPEAEPRWEACNAQEWEDALDPRTFTRATVRESVTSLIFDEGYPVSNNWSAFATTMLMHAVNIHMWHTLQCSQSSVSLEGTLATQAEHALARCYALLTVDRPEFEQHAESVEGPSMFNCQALLRSAYVRLFTGIGSFNRMMLLSGSQEQINSSIQAFVETPQERNSFLTKAVGKAYGGFLTPIKAGYLVVVKTAALSWSVEHAIAAWDCALFITKWMHAIETQRHLPGRQPNEAEQQNLDNFRSLLEEVDSEYCDDAGSMAAEVARTWAGFLDDTWVWGITPKMGALLRMLGDAYEEDWKRKVLPLQGGEVRMES